MIFGRHSKLYWTQTKPIHLNVLFSLWMHVCVRVCLIHEENRFETNFQTLSRFSSFLFTWCSPSSLVTAQHVTIPSMISKMCDTIAQREQIIRLYRLSFSFNFFPYFHFFFYLFSFCYLLLLSLCYVPRICTPVLLYHVLFGTFDICVCVFHSLLHSFTNTCTFTRTSFVNFNRI